MICSEPLRESTISLRAQSSCTPPPKKHTLPSSIIRHSCSYSPATSLPRASSRFAGSISVIYPKVPKLTPMMGMFLSPISLAACSTVPSPPSTIMQSASFRSRSLWSQQPARPAAKDSENDSVSSPPSPLVTTAARCPACFKKPQIRFVTARSLSL